MARPGERLPRGDTEPARGGNATRRPGLELREALARVQGRARAPPLPEGGPRRLAQGELRGVVVLPTGAGKTAVAIQGIERVGRSALVVVPTLALLKQWYSVLFDSFGASVTVGLLGGGYTKSRHSPSRHTTLPTSTPSATATASRSWSTTSPPPPRAQERRHLEDAHRPYSLGLTATPSALTAATSYSPSWPDPSSTGARPRTSRIYLAPFELVRIPVELTAHERFEYAQADAVYRDFLAKHRLPMRSPEDWQRFILVAATSHSGGGRRRCAAQARDPGGRHAEGGDSTLLRRHWDDRVIVFAKSVEEVYSLSRRF